MIAKSNQQNPISAAGLALVGGTGASGFAAAPGSCRAAALHALRGNLTNFLEWLAWTFGGASLRKLENRAISRLVLGLLLTIPPGAAALAPTANECDVKAAFLINFARYVAWPEGAFHDASDPLTICVLGQNPFGHALDDLVAGKTIEGRPLEVRRIPDANSAGVCRVLFIGLPERKAARSIAGAPPEPAILTVGDAGGPASEGTVINFTKEDGKVRFTVNMQAADREQLRISSRLLGLASSVKR